jgi:hypothetical protein
VTSAGLRALLAVGLSPRPGGSRSAGPVVGPGLQTVVCPDWIRAQAGDAGGCGPECWDGEQLDALAPPAGLVPPENLDTQGEARGRNGLGGLTRHGKRAIRESAGLLEEDRECLSFWTVSPSDDAIGEIWARDAWPDFVAAVRHGLVRKLRAQGLDGEVIGVCELFPQRSRDACQPIPHLHILYRSKRHRWSDWALEPSEHDEMILGAYRAIGIGCRDVRASSRVEPIRKSVRRYLSKYLRKGTSPLQEVPMPAIIGAAIGRIMNVNFQRGVVLRLEILPLVMSALRAACAEMLRLVPRQWWFQSRKLRDEVRALTVCLPPSFAVWMVAEWENVRNGVCADLYFCETGQGRGPPCWVISWASPEEVAHAMALWEQDLRDRLALPDSILYGRS